MAKKKRAEFNPDVEKFETQLNREENNLKDKSELKDEKPPKEVKETKTESTVGKEFDPFEGEVIRRPHTEYQIDNETMQQIASEPIPEPTIIPPKLDLNDNDDDDIADSEVIEPPKEPSKFDKITNPAVDNLTKKEINRGAEQTANMFISAYAGLHKLGIKFASVTEEKIYKKAVNGELDPDILEVEIPDGKGKTISVRQFINDYNAQLEDALTLDEEWVEGIRPVLVRVLAKRGWVLSDEQFLLFELGKDLVTKASVVISLKYTMNSSLKAISTQLMTMKKENAELQRQLQVQAEENERLKNAQKSEVENQENKAKTEGKKKMSEATSDGEIHIATPIEEDK